jgi:hypothetical protein
MVVVLWKMKGRNVACNGTSGSTIEILPPILASNLMMKWCHFKSVVLSITVHCSTAPAAADPGRLNQVSNKDKKNMDGIKYCREN